MKKVPLMTQPQRTDKKSTIERRQVIREKQQQKNKLKQEKKSVSPTILRKSKVQQSKSIQKFQVKKQLFPIPEYIDNLPITISNIKPNNLQFIETKNQQKHQPHKSFNQQERSPSFQRTSLRVSQKRYNVSLASGKSERGNQLSRNSSAFLKSKRQMSKSQILTQNKNHSKSPFHIIENQQEADKWIQSTLKKVKNQSIKLINQEFLNVIQQPLKLQNQISKTATQTQRCLIHNTPFSLYCSIDRQLLCVGCIYSQKSHKSHQVLPLSKAEKQMKEDIQAFRNRIDETMIQSQHLIRQSSLNLIKIEKHYPVILSKIQAYYSSIHDMIDQKKRQQLQYVQNIRQQYKTQLKVIGQLLNKVNNMFIEKLKYIALQSKNIENDLKKMRTSYRNDALKIDVPIQQISIQMTIKTRCSYEILSKYHKILQKHSDHLFDQRDKFDIRIENFDQVIDLIKYKLAIVIPVMKRDPNSKGFGDFLTGDDGGNFFDTKNDQNKEQQAVKQKVTQSKINQEKSLLHKKQFSTAPQVPKGLSRRFL